jgi:hypothetical protein
MAPQASSTRVSVAVGSEEAPGPGPVISWDIVFSSQVWRLASVRVVQVRFDLEVDGSIA